MEMLVPPRPAAEVSGSKTGLTSRNDVVVKPVADVQHLVSTMTRLGHQPVEERRRRLFDAPVVGGRDEIDPEIELAKQRPGAGGLIPGDAHEVATTLEFRDARPNIRIQVASVEELTATRVQ